MGNDMTLTDFLSLLEDLSRCRPVFHSERDFQLAFAWYLHETIPDSQARLEFKAFKNEKMYLDIWLKTLGIAIELKYYTRELNVEQEGEHFTLLNQAAYPPRRYDFISDIRRLERVVRGFELAKSGLAVLLTNDPSYWKPPRQGWKNAVDAAFRIHEDRVLKGKMDWSDDTYEGTRRGREKPIKLKGSYNITWRDYSAFEEKKYGKFRYLVAEVPDLRI